MLMPSIFVEDLFNDWMDFSFPQVPDVDKELYGKHAKNMMKTDVKETEEGYDFCDLPDELCEKYIKLFAVPEEIPDEETEQDISFDFYVI